MKHSSLSHPAQTDGFVSNFVETLAVGARREQTRRAYARAAEYFLAWARIRGAEISYPVQEELLILFLADHLDEKPNRARDQLAHDGWRKSARPCAVNTVRYFLKCVSQEHARRGLVSSCNSVRVRQVLRDARRFRPYRIRQRGTRAITLGMVNLLLSQCDNSLPPDGPPESGNLRGLRDRALIAVAFFTGGRRRGEMADMRWEDLVPGVMELDEATTLHGYYWHLFRHKVDRMDPEVRIPLFHPTAVEALKRWRAALHVCGNDHGPVFRNINRHGQPGNALSANAINVHVIQRRLQELRIDTTYYSAHSLRSGWLVQAGLEGIAIQEAMRLTLHHDVNTAKRYHDQGREEMTQALRVGFRRSSG